MNAIISSEVHPNTAATSVAEPPRTASSGCSGRPVPRTGKNPGPRSSSEVRFRRARSASGNRRTSACWSDLRSEPTPRWERKVRVSAAAASAVWARGVEPLMETAWWNRPRADGMARRVVTFAPPPDSPKTVTFPGSPPNVATLSRTHSSAATMSSIPTRPESASPGWTEERSRNPSEPTRWFRPIITTSCLRARLSNAYIGHDAEPTDQPPPWSQTSTGRPADPSSVGVQTLRTRQSSSVTDSMDLTPVRGSASAGIDIPVNCSVVICGHDGP